MKVLNPNEYAGYGSYMVLADTLERIAGEVLVVAFSEGSVLLLDEMLPRVRADPVESLEQTLRREIHKSTGALLDLAQLLGVWHLSECERLIVYVARVARVESVTAAGRVRLAPLGEAWVQEEGWLKVRDFILHHAYKKGR